MIANITAVIAGSASESATFDLSTAHPFSSVYDYHIPQGLFTIVGAVILVVLVVSATALVCLKTAGCPLHQQRRAHRKKKTSFLDQEDQEKRYPRIEPGIIIPEVHVRADEPKQRY
ncbi:uncharacterized protein [Periplaneta americana]|uniref:uncharacterized protein n=1 Tax=Periplaneta americana TaxID=6978 RepID=UPI0037E9BFD1